MSSADADEMIHLTLLDGTLIDVEVEEIVEVLPFGDGPSSL